MQNELILIGNFTLVVQIMKHNLLFLKAEKVAFYALSILYLSTIKIWKQKRWLESETVNSFCHMWLVFTRWWKTGDVTWLGDEITWLVSWLDLPPGTRREEDIWLLFSLFLHLHLLHQLLHSGEGDISEELGDLVDKEMQSTTDAILQAEKRIEVKLTWPLTSV